MKNLILICVIGLVSPVICKGKVLAAKKQKIKSLVSSFYLKKAMSDMDIKNTLKLNSFSENHDCNDHHQTSCIDAACSHLASYECDDQSEIKEIAALCSNVNGACINTVCSHLDSYECDDKSELREIANMCSGLHDYACIDSVCSHLASYDCDDTSELKNVIATCKNP
jgi:hypothetical protein